MLVLALPTGIAGQEGRRATVRLDGRAVLELGAAGAQGAVERARAIEARLGVVLDENADPDPAVVVAEADTVRTLLVNGVLVARVHQADARRAAASLDATAARWGRLVDEALDDAARRRAATGGRFGSAFVGSVRTALARVAESATHNIPRYVAAIGVLATFWLLAYFARRGLRWLFQRTLDDRTVENLLYQVVYAAIWVLGIIVAVGTLGWDPAAVATGIGLSGLALGFALKDVLSNFVSGVLILATRPFRVGDQIIVGETEGTVRRIELRATHIRTYDGRIALIPNAELFTSRVINNTYTPVRRGSVAFRVGYGEEIDEVVLAALRALRATEGVMENPEPSVEVRELAEDICMDARFWADSRRSDFRETASRVRSALVRELRDAGIELPDPDRRRVVVTRPGDGSVPSA